MKMTPNEAMKLTLECMTYMLNCGDIGEAYVEQEEIIYETAQMMRMFLVGNFNPIIEGIREVMPEDKERKSYGKEHTDYEFLELLIDKIERVKMRLTDGYILNEHF